MALAAKKGNSAPEAIFNRALVAALPDGVIIYSADGQCGWANEAAGKLLGIPRERLLKQNFREISSWKEWGLLARAEETMRTGHPLRWETPITPAPGTSLWLDFRLTRVELSGEATLLVILADVSERKRAEEALRVSEERCRGLADATPDLIFSFDRNLSLTGINRAAARSLGLKIEEALGRHIAGLGLPPEIHRRWKRKCSGVLASGRPAERLLNEFTLADGQAHLNETSLWPILTPDGDVVGVEGVTRDITERKQAEELLRASEQRYRSLFGSANDGIILHDLEGRILETNSIVSERLGYSSEELLGMNVSDIRVSEASALYPEHMDEVRKRGRALFETTHLRRDGSTMPVEVSSRLTEDAGREVVLSISRDVTERRQAEEALARSEEHFRALIENSSDLVAVIDGAGVFQFQSPSSDAILGYRPEELIGRSAFDFIHPDDMATTQRAFAELMREQRDPSRIVELRFHHKDGSWRTLEVMGTGLVEPTGELTCVLNSRDISERKQAEEALKESEEQLRQAQKMEVVGQLAGGIAHDFNNLLTAIIGNSSLALATMAPEDPNRELIADVKEVGQRAAALTRQILAFSRRQMLKPQILCLNTVILDMEPLLRRTLGEDVELQFSLASDAKESEIDPHQIGQVLLNLVLNARDAMPEGGRLVIETANARLEGAYCHTHPGVKAGGYVMLAVSDTGCGMDTETQAHIFEPFFTTKEVGKGTGLGLSSAFGIVKQSGGSISVYSEPGEGSTFRVYLPVAQASVAPVAESAEGQDESRPGYERILVVEDESSVRELVVRVLSHSGYRVMAAGSAQEVEAVLEKGEPVPDLLLTDVVLPGGKSGRQVAETLATRYPDLPTIFMSGYTRDSVVRDGRLDPDIEFLEKPFMPETLLRKVREVLDAGATRARQLVKSGSG